MWGKEGKMNRKNKRPLQEVVEEGTTKKSSYPYLFIVFNRTAALPVKAKSHQVNHQQAW